jgi:hypothetical protein
MMQSYGRTESRSSAKHWSYPLIAATNRMAVTFSKQCILKIQRLINSS